MSGLDVLVSEDRTVILRIFRKLCVELSKTERKPRVARKAKDLMQGMKALICLKVRAIRRRWPCTERRPPRRGGSGAVTVRLAVRVERSATSKEAVGTKQTRVVELREFCRQQGAERGRPMGAGAGRSQSDPPSTYRRACPASCRRPGALRREKAAGQVR